MRSGELADIAGVTVRTLRHYHKVGVLPEPERSENGYRNYEAYHLATVLRIQRMSKIGLSLKQIRVIMESQRERDNRTIHKELLILDATIEKQINLLKQQRKAIASLQNAGADPSIPSELVPFFLQLQRSKVAEEVVETQKQLAVLIDHLRPVDGVQVFKEVLGEMNKGENFRYAEELSARFFQLSKETSEFEQTQLLEDMIAFLGHFPFKKVQVSGEDDPWLKEIVESITYGTAGLNTTQNFFLEELYSKLEAYPRGGS